MPETSVAGGREAARRRVLVVRPIRDGLTLLDERDGESARRAGARAAASRRARRPPPAGACSTKRRSSPPYEGRLHGAGRDVFDEEPLPTTSPLVGEPCFVLSPHSAALTEDTVRAMSIATVRDVLDAFDGCLDAPSVVNPAVLAASPRHDVDEDGAP